MDMADPLLRTVGAGGIPAGHRHVATAPRLSSAPSTGTAQGPQPTRLFGILPHGLGNLPDSWVLRRKSEVRANWV